MSKRNSMKIKSHKKNLIATRSEISAAHKKMKDELGKHPYAKYELQLLAGHVKRMKEGKKK